MATILILEDEEGIRRLFRLLLCEDGHDVLEAATAEQANQLSACKTIDVLVADIVLPGGKSGTDFAVALMQTQPQVRVLFVSGWFAHGGNNAENIASLPNGSYAILPKPFGNNELLKRVRSLVEPEAVNGVG